MSRDSEAMFFIFYKITQIVYVFLAKHNKYERGENTC